MLALTYRAFHSLHWGLLLSMGLNCSALIAQTEIPPPPSSQELAAGVTSNSAAASSQETDATKKQNTEKTADYIRKWKEAVERTKRLECAIEVTKVDKVFSDKNKSSGNFQFLKIKLQAETKSYRNLDLKSGSPGNTISRRLINETIYTINNGSKYISIANYSKITDEQKKKMNSEFFSSIKLATIEEPVEISDFISNPNRILKHHDLGLCKEDAYYLYFSLRLKSKGDRSSSVRGQLVLSKDTFLVRRIWWGGPNDEVYYDFTRMSLAPELKLNDFAEPDREQFKGWTIYEMEYDR